MMMTAVGSLHSLSRSTLWRGLLWFGVAVVAAVGLAASAEAAKPTVTGVSPTSAINSGTVKLTITGTELNTATAATLKLAGQDDIPGTSFTPQGATSVSANFDIRAAAPGPWDVVVTNPDGFGTCTRCFTVTATAPPTVNSVTPDHVGQGATNTDITLSGSDFARGDTVTFDGSGITVNSTTFVSTTTVTANISVLSSASTGARTITVTHTSGYGSDSCDGCLTIDPGPTVDSADPGNAGQGAKDLDVIITGTNFAGTPTVSFSGAGITVGDVERNSAARLTATIDIEPTAATGSRNITVTNPNAGAATGSGIFKVNDGPPPVGTVSPTNGGQGSSGLNIIVSRPSDPLGKREFSAGSKVSLSGVGITVNSTTLNANLPPLMPSTLTANVDISPDAPTGKRDLIVTNPDNGRSVCTECFTVNPGPKVTSVTPDAGGQNASHEIVRITGENFVATPTVAFTGGGVTVNSVTQISTSQLTVDLSIAASATTGARVVVVTNSDKGRGTCAECFTVNPGPALSSASPSRLAQGTTAKEVILTGGGFTSTPTVSVSGQGVVVDKVVRDSETELIATMTVASSAAIGVRDITVVNPDFGAATCTGCLTVTAGPTVTSVTPSAGPNTGSFTVQIGGTNFATGASATLEHAGQPDIEGTAVTVDSATSMQATFDLRAVAPGPWNMRVTNSDFGSGACSGCFAVAASAPTVTKAEPAKVSQGASHEEVKITGSNFARGAVASFSGSGITVHSTKFVDTSHVIANITVSSGGATGNRDVVVSNTDSQLGSCLGCFTVTKRVTVSLSSPSVLTGPVVATFGANVRGVTTRNFVLRVSGTSTSLAAKSLTCKNASGATTSCSGTSVRKAALTPRNSLIPGQHYTASINPSGTTLRVTDAAGAAVPTTSKSFRASRIEQETSVRATDTWGSVSAPSAFGASFTRERLAGAKATYRFTGTSITWYTVTGPDQGTAKVYIDGRLKKTVNNYSSARNYKVARGFSGLTSKAHTILIKPTGQRGSSRGTSSYVSVDAFRAGSGGVVTSPSLTYEWAGASLSSASGDRYARSNTTRASMSFTFHGTGIDWYTVFTSSNGKANVYIDGKLVKTADTYRSSTSVGRYSFRGLSHTVHTMKIVVSGTRSSASRGTYVSVDRWVVQ